MSNDVTGQEIRRVLLEIIDEFSKIGPGYFQTRSILIEASQRLKIRNNLAYEQALLTLYYDLLGVDSYHGDTIFQIPTHLSAI